MDLSLLILFIFFFFEAPVNYVSSVRTSSPKAQEQDLLGHGCFLPHTLLGPDTFTSISEYLLSISGSMGQLWRQTGVQGYWFQGSCQHQLRDHFWRFWGYTFQKVSTNHMNTFSKEGDPLPSHLGYSQNGLLCIYEIWPDSKNLDTIKSASHGNSPQSRKLVTPSLVYLVPYQSQMTKFP